jgi:hypothetical protein
VTRFGERRLMARVIRPAAWKMMPRLRHVRGAIRPDRAWARAAVANTKNTTMPARPLAGWCSVPAMNPGASEANREKTAQAVTAPAAAAM